MTAAHGIALAIFITGVATQMQGLHAWSEVRSIPFVCGCLMNIAGMITAMCSKQLGRGDEPRSRSTDA